jgi:CheY-like chemotaxis protein
MNSNRMLIIDDDHNLCELMREVAEGLGFNVQATTDAEEFKTLYGAGVELVVLDLMLGGSDGTQLMRFLAQRSSTARIILVSGIEQSVLQAASRLAGELGLNVVTCLPKPFRVHQLAEVLRRQLSATRSLSPSPLAGEGRSEGGG